MPISWIRHPALPAKGELGLTHSPGAVRHSRDAELNSLARRKVQTIVCLQEENEFPALPEAETLAARREAVEERAIEFVHVPIADFAAPSLDQALHLCQVIGAGLAREERWIMHCWAGLGRAGTIAACVLIDHDVSAEEAIETVRRYRPGAIQSAAQLEFVRAWEIWPGRRRR